MCCVLSVSLLQVRVILERLVRRLDYESVAEHIPEEERKLLIHIRKEQQRKARKSQAGGRDEVSLICSFYRTAHISNFMWV